MPTIPSNPNKKPTLPPSEQLPLVKSDDKTGDSSVNPTQDDSTTAADGGAVDGHTSGDTLLSDNNSGQSETPTNDPGLAYETIGFTDDGQDPSADNYSDDSVTASTEGSHDSSDDTYYDDSVTASADATQDTTADTPEDNTITSSTDGTQTSDDTS